MSQIPQFMQLHYPSRDMTVMYREVDIVVLSNFFLHPFYHTPMWNISVLFMLVTSRFFRLNAYDSNVIQGDQIRRFGVISFKKQIIKWRRVNNQATSFLTFLYFIHISHGFEGDIPEYQPRGDTKAMTRYVTRCRRKRVT